MSKDGRHAFLDKVFGLVHDPRDWRAPIEKRVPKSKFEAIGASKEDISEAVVHFTSTVPTVTDTGSAYVVKAIGYRNGPAGP